MTGKTGQMEDTTRHARTKWSIRGDYNRSLNDAWNEGEAVICPHQDYSEARYDRESDTILLSAGGVIKTVLSDHGGTVVLFKEPVECDDCGEMHKLPRGCPECGSRDWS